MNTGELRGQYAKAIKSYNNIESMWNTTKRIYGAAKTRFGYTVSIDSADWLWNEVHQWLLGTVRTGKVHALQAVTVDRGLLVDDEQDGPQRSVQFLSNDNHTQVVYLEGHRIDVTLTRPPVSPYEPRVDLAKRRDTLTFTARTAAGRDAIKALLDSLVVAKEGAEKRPTLRMLSRWGHWERRNDIARRSTDSVILRDGVLEDIRNDLKEFLADEDWYVRLNMPYHRGYLFWGPPGTGKTSLAKALANEFSLDAWYLPLGDLSSDTDLLSVVNAVAPGSVLLLEDVDVYHAATQREDSKGRTSLSGLLNALDGFATPHGLITFLTSNRPDILDEALVRPGRVDKKVHLDYVDQAQANRVFEFFYGRPPEADIPIGAETSPADLIELFKKHRNEPWMVEGAATV